MCSEERGKPREKVEHVVDVFQLREGTPAEAQPDCRSRQVTMPNRMQDSLGSSRSGSSKQHWGTDQRKLWQRRDQFVVERQAQ